MRGFKNLDQVKKKGAKINRSIGQVHRYLIGVQRKLMKLRIDAEKHTMEAQMLSNRGIRVPERYFIEDKKILKLKELVRRIKDLQINYRDNKI